MLSGVAPCSHFVNDKLSDKVSTGTSCGTWEGTFHMHSDKHSFTSQNNLQYNSHN